jgi:hypothetical protein
MPFAGGLARDRPADVYPPQLIDGWRGTYKTSDAVPDE